MKLVSDRRLKKTANGLMTAEARKEIGSPPMTGPRVKETVGLIDSLSGLSPPTASPLQGQNSGVGVGDGNRDAIGIYGRLPLC